MMRYYIYCVGIVIYVLSAQGLPSNINGTPQEVIFLLITIALNLSFWKYLMGSISGQYHCFNVKGVASSCLWVSPGF